MNLKPLGDRVIVKAVEQEEVTASGIVGMATLKRSTHWCPACGSVLRCVDCAGRPTAQEMRARLRARRAA